MDIQERIKFLVDNLASGKYTVFAKNCSIPVSTFKTYIDGPTNPTSGHLRKIASVYRVNLNWLILGDGEPFVEGSTQEGEATGRGKVMAIDPVVQLLNERRSGPGSPSPRTNAPPSLKFSGSWLIGMSAPFGSYYVPSKEGRKKEMNSDGQDCNDVGGIDLTGEFRLIVKKFLEMRF